MSVIEIAGSLIPGSTDTPLDARTRIASISEVETIANPYVSMPFSVLDTGKTYKVKSLKAKMIGPIQVPNALIDEYELVPDAETIAELREEIAGIEIPDSGGTVKSVNGTEPDANGNVSLELETGTVKSVNGVEPDANGNVLLELETDAVKSVNGMEPDEEGNVQVEAASLPASILTIPIPSDADNHTLSLMVDICENGDFSEEEVTHILMAAHREKMKIFSDGQFVDIPEDGIGTPYYGETLVFQLDNEMMESYEPGTTYYGRYRWMDSEGGRTDWCGFKFTYDMNDLRPIKLSDTASSKVATVSTLTGSPVIDYLNGDIQNFSMSSNVIINRDNIRNIPYGKALMLIIQKQGDCTLTVTSGSVSEVLTLNKTYLIGAVDVGQILLTVSETVG